MSDPLCQRPDCTLSFQTERTDRPMPMTAFMRILMDRHLGSGAAKGTAAATLALRHPAKAHRAENPIQRKLGWIGGKTPIREAGMVRSKGFLLVSATPPTRSSYHADRDFDALRAARKAVARALNQDKVQQCPTSARKGGEI